MKLFLLSQNTNNEWDTYDSAVVCAESEEDAKTIHPQGLDYKVGEEQERFDTWVMLSNVIVEYLGEAREDSERRIICSSYNAS